MKWDKNKFEFIKIVKDKNDKVEEEDKSEAKSILNDNDNIF